MSCAVSAGADRPNPDSVARTVPNQITRPLGLHQAARISASEFRRRIYELAKSLPDLEKFALTQQMIRAAVSVTNNMAEGYGRYHWQESMQFFRHSRGSLMELVDDLNVCRDQNYMAASHHEELRKHAEDLLPQINGYIRYLRQKKSD